MDNKGFVDRFFSLVKDKGITVKKLIDDLGLPVKGPYRWRSEGAYPDALTACRVAKYLGVSVEYLITGEEPDVPWGKVRECASEIEALSSRLSALASEVTQASGS